MKQVLEQLNSVSDVIGSLVCSRDGHQMNSSFPPIFENRILDEASRLISASVISGYADVGSQGQLDLRFSDGRMIVRSLDSGLLFVLCTKGVNLQMLNISLNIAVKRLNEILKPVESSTVEKVKPQGAQPQLQPPAQQTPHPPAADLKDNTPPRASVSSDSDPRILIVDELDSSTEAGRGFQELGMAAVTASTSQQLCRSLNVAALKRIKLSNIDNGSTGIFGLMVINDDSDRYAGKIIISRHIEKKLSAVKGNRLKAESA